MGHAFHRKRMDISHARTRGCGIHYVEPSVAPVPGAQELAEREAVAQQHAAAQLQAALTNQERKNNIDTLMRFADRCLTAWREEMDQRDQQLVNFPGWTKANYCELPVDQEAAGFYTGMIAYYRRGAERELNPDELDEAIKVGCQRNVSTEQIVAKANDIVRRSVSECFHSDGVDVRRFIKLLTRRSINARQYNSGLDQALAFVAGNFQQALKELI
jgi:hypothetical protein